LYNCLTFASVLITWIGLFLGIGMYSTYGFIRIGKLQDLLIIIGTINW
jgi:hypothetical protein